MKTPTNLTNDTSIKKILFVSHSCLSYGAERSLLSLVVSLSRVKNLKPIVLLPCKGFLSESLRKKGIEIIIFPFFNWISSLKLYFFNSIGFLLNYLLMYLFVFFIKNKGIELVYTNSLATNFGALIANKINKKHIWHIREFVEEDLNRVFIPSLFYVKNFVKTHTSFIVYNSKVVSNKFIQWFPSTNSKVVYNGFDFQIEELHQDRYQKLIVEQQPIMLVVMGSIRYEKGQHDAIKCLIELRSRNVNVVLNVVGKGKKEYINELKIICKNAHVLEYVKFIGLVDKPLEYFKAAAVSLVPSSQEAFGRVVVESCSVGCPAVVANSGGLKEIIKDGKTGFVFENGNIKDMANKVENLLRDKKKYNIITTDAIRDVVSRFSLQKYCNEINSIINLVN